MSLVRAFTISFLSLLLARCGLNNSYVEENATFVNPVDKVPLSGTITYPANLKNTAPAVVLIHGSGPCDRDLNIAAGTGLFRELAHFLASKGIIVLRYDKRGVGLSGGNYESYAIEHFTVDGIAAVKYLESIPRVCKNKIGAIGISQGGIVVPLMQQEYPSINYIVLMCSPGKWGKDFFLASQLALAEITDTTSTGYIKNKLLMDELWSVLTSDSLNNSEREYGKNVLNEMWSYINNIERRTLGYTEMNLDVWINEFTKPNLRRWYSYNQEKTLSKLNCPVLAISGDKDVQAPAGFNLKKMREAFSKGTNEEYKIIELHNVNHLFQNCATGMPSEYSRLGKDFSTKGFESIADWINKLHFE